MKERPIIFSAPMVRAILEGRKTQTRRVCKNKVYANGFGFNGHDFNCYNDYLPPSALLMDYRAGGYDLTTSDLEGWGGACPYGQPGYRLWVRETWQGPLLDEDYDHPEDDDIYTPKYCVYRADGGPVPEFVTCDDKERSGWRPSIHMPRWASRILLEVVSVRVERLQDISRGDAMAEGCPFPNMAHGDDPRDWYRGLRDEINGPESWDANPWVWVVEFRRITP